MIWCIEGDGNFVSLRGDKSNFTEAISPDQDDTSEQIALMTGEAGGTVNLFTLGHVYASPVWWRKY